MRDMKYVRGGTSLQQAVITQTNFSKAAHELCENALEDAASQLHPLLRRMELNRLDERREFVQAFRSALEQRVGHGFAAWQPGVQAVFRYDETGMGSVAAWDGSIRLLVKVPRLSRSVQALAKMLDAGLVRALKQKRWQRFQTRSSVLEVHQVTPNELRHRVGYGAMFCAVHTAPVEIWPREMSAPKL